MLLGVSSACASLRSDSSMAIVIPPEINTLKRTIVGLRAACAQHLDIDFSHSVKYNGKWRSLTVAELTEFYETRRDHIIGFQQLLNWATTASAQPVGGEGVGTAFAFWFSPEGDKKLPWVAVEGLKSAVKHGGFDKVVLLTYNALEDVPAGVVVQSAEDCLPFEVFKRLLEAGKETLPGFIAPLADYVRLLACAHSDAAATWLIDVDTIWLRSAKMEYYFGHCFGTFHVNKVSYLSLNVFLVLVRGCGLLLVSWGPRIWIPYGLRADSFCELRRTYARPPPLGLF